MFRWIFIEWAWIVMPFSPRTSSGPETIGPSLIRIDAIDRSMCPCRCPDSSGSTLFPPSQGSAPQFQEFQESIGSTLPGPTTLFFTHAYDLTPFQPPLAFSRSPMDAGCLCVWARGRAGLASEVSKKPLKPISKRPATRHRRRGTLFSEREDGATQNEPRFGREMVLDGIWMFLRSG